MNTEAKFNERIEIIDVLRGFTLLDSSVHFSDRILRAHTPRSMITSIFIFLAMNS